VVGGVATLRSIFLTVFLLVLCGPIAQAEVIDLEGTVKTMVLTSGP